MKTFNCRLCLLVGLLWAGTLTAYDFEYDAGDIEGEKDSTGITYTLSVSKEDLGTSYDFDTKEGVTSGSPTGIDINVSSGGATGTKAYPDDSLPTANFTISMNGKLIPPSGGSGTQPTWGASGNAKAPFLITSEISQIMWIDGTATFSTTLPADWYISGTKLHSGKTFTIGTHWVPIVAEKYSIIAKNQANNDEIRTAELVVVEPAPISVDASSPASTKVNYRLKPNTVTCDAIFTVNNYVTSKSVKDTFYFAFNQNALITDTKILLELSNNELSKKDIVVDLSITEKTKADSHTNAVAYFLEDSIGTRFFNWSAMVTYTAYQYNISEIATGLLLSFKAQTSPKYTASATGSLVSSNPTDPSFIFAFDNTTGQQRILEPVSGGLTPSFGINFNTYLPKPSMSAFQISVRTDTGTAGIFVSGQSITLTCN